MEKGRFFFRVISFNSTIRFGARVCGACAAIDFTKKSFLLHVSSTGEALPRNSLNQTPARLDFEIVSHVRPIYEIWDAP
jgi:hypothetical protein